MSTENNINSIDKKSSLMDDIVAIRNTMWEEDNDDDARPETVRVGELSDAFARLDPDLIMLHKELKTAAIQLEKEGSGPMRDIMQWRYDSAESAYQTRLLEVRRKKMEREAELAAARKRDIDEQTREGIIAHELAMQQKMNDHFAALRAQRLKEKQKKDSNSSFWTFFLFFAIGILIANSGREQRRREEEMERNYARNAFSSKAYRVV